MTKNLLLVGLLLSSIMAVGQAPFQEAASSVPPGFVYTEGSKFKLEGKDFYFSGTNVYDFFTYGASSGDVETQYMDKERIDEHMRTLYTNGIRVVRLWGFSHEEWHGFEVEKGVYNEPQFALFDYIVKSAEANGLRLIVALENYWNDYGGIKTRLEWEGIDVSGGGAHDQGQFFTNRPAIEGYKDYVEYFITRVNHYDGVAYKDDKTILAWELMNEPRYQGFGDDLSSDVLRAWVDEMGEFIKSIDSSHLLGTGLEAHGTKYGFGGNEGNDFIKIHQSPYIDFSSAHPYIRESWSNFDVEMTKKVICQWAEESHDILNKPLYIGEFNVERNERTEWWEDIYAFVEEKKIGASAFWWFPDEGTPRDKFAVLEGDTELSIFKDHAHKMEAMSGGEAIYLSLLAPKPGSKFLEGSTVEIIANSINENNTIAEMSFYRNDLLIGTDTEAPFSMLWQNTTAGQYAITAVAKSSDGSLVSSSPVNLQIGGELLSLEYKDVSSDAITNVIKPHFQLTNNSSQDIPYEDITIRYWFTSELDKPLQFASDYSVLGTSYVSGEFVRVKNNEYYLEVSIAPDAGVLSSLTNSGRMETKIHYNDYSDFDQSDDYSYAPSIKDFALSERVTAYVNGTLIYGQEPIDGPKATLSANVDSGTAPLEVIFDASASSTPDGGALSFSWDFGNGDVATGMNPTYTFTSPGAYTVTLTATDADGDSSTDSMVITAIEPSQRITIDLVGPDNGRSFQIGKKIRLRAEAFSSYGDIARVAFFDNGTRIKTDSKAPYIHAWLDATLGEHLLTARVTDTEGNTKLSAPVSITVVEKLGPTVAITSPFSGDSFSSGASVRVSVDAEDEDGLVNNVALLVDGQFFARDRTVPYDFDISTLTGAHVLTARAIDNNGNRTLSAPVNITVQPSSKCDNCNSSVTIVSSKESEIVPTDEEIAIFPNPTSLDFQLQLPLSDTKTKIVVRDYLGKVLFSNEHSGHNAELLRFGQDFKPGMYIVHMSKGQKVITQQIVKR